MKIIDKFRVVTAADVEFPLMKPPPEESPIPATRLPGSGKPLPHVYVREVEWLREILDKSIPIADLPDGLRKLVTSSRQLTILLTALHWRMRDIVKEIEERYGEEFAKLRHAYDVIFGELRRVLEKAKQHFEKAGYSLPRAVETYNIWVIFIEEAKKFQYHQKLHALEEYLKEHYPGILEEANKAIEKEERAWAEEQKAVELAFYVIDKITTLLDWLGLPEKLKESLIKHVLQQAQEIEEKSLKSLERKVGKPKEELGDTGEELFGPGERRGAVIRRFAQLLGVQDSVDDIVGALEQMDIHIDESLSALDSVMISLEKIRALLEAGIAATKEPEEEPEEEPTVTV